MRTSQVGCRGGRQTATRPPQALLFRAGPLLSGPARVPGPCSTFVDAPLAPALGSGCPPVCAARRGLVPSGPMGLARCRYRAPGRPVHFQVRLSGLPGPTPGISMTIKESSGRSERIRPLALGPSFGEGSERTLRPWVPIGHPEPSGAERLWAMCSLAYDLRVVAALAVAGLRVDAEDTAGSLDDVQAVEQIQLVSHRAHVG